MKWRNRLNRRNFSNSKYPELKWFLEYALEFETDELYGLTPDICKKRLKELGIDSNIDNYIIINIEDMHDEIAQMDEIPDYVYYPTNARDPDHELWSRIVEQLFSLKDTSKFVTSTGFEVSDWLYYNSPLEFVYIYHYSVIYFLFNRNSLRKSLKYL